MKNIVRFQMFLLAYLLLLISGVNRLEDWGIVKSPERAISIMLDIPLILIGLVCLLFAFFCLRRFLQMLPLLIPALGINFTDLLAGRDAPYTRPGTLAVSFALTIVAMCALFVYRRGARTIPWLIITMAIFVATAYGCRVCEREHMWWFILVNGIGYIWLFGRVANWLGANKEKHPAASAA